MVKLISIVRLLSLDGILPKEKGIPYNCTYFYTKWYCEYQHFVFAQKPLSL